MDSWLNPVRGNASLHLRAFFQAGGHPTAEPMVEIRFHVSKSRIHHPSRIVQVESQPDVFGIFLPLSDLFSHQLRRLHIEHMLSYVGHPHRGDIDFWADQISSYAFHCANAVLLEGCSGILVVVDLNISTVWFSDFAEMIALGEEFGEAGLVIDEELLLSWDTEGEFGAVPASESSIKALETKRYQGDGKYGSTCSVCLDDFLAGDELMVMPCSHEFHQFCATEWLERSSLCPLCRYAMPTDDEEGVTA